MILEAVPDPVFRNAYMIQDTETGLTLSDANSFNFLIDHRRMFPTHIDGLIEIDNWKILFDENRPDISHSGGH